MAKADIDKSKFPPLDSVTLTLQTETKKDASGKINLWFVKLGGGAGNGSSTQMTLVLKPVVAAAHVATGGIDRTLADAIISAAKGVGAAQKDPNTPLQLDSLSVEMKFTLTKQASGGVEFTIAPIGGGISGNISNNNTHTLLVKFASVKKS